MKKKVLYTVMLSLLSSVSAYAMGLGDIKVRSYLDQPFSADIELIDVGNTPLSGIKANLASAEDFERVGLERTYAPSLLIFSVEKHANGKAFIKVSSIERITDPFMQLLVDLAWAEGQVYRSYTILLDPPNYQLSIVKHQLNNIVKRQYDAKPSTHATVAHGTVTYSQVERAPVSTDGEPRRAATYGPTQANETIWQIAQHYKTGDVSLQQIILAIVGTNSQAFTEGNLNGLKDASSLQIPVNSIINKVPVSLARLEVLAHDKAWQTRTPIEHALLPPYIDTAAATSGNEQQITPVGLTINHSEIPSAPTFHTPASVTPSARFLPLTSSLLSVGEDAAVSRGASKKSVVTQQARIHADMDIAAAAIASVREVNALLAEQLRTLQTDNKRLQKQLAARRQEMKQLRNKINVLLERQGVLGQVSQQRLATEKNSILPWFLLLLVLGGCGFFYWTFWVRQKGERSRDLAASSGTPPLEPMPAPPVEIVEKTVVLPTEEKQVSSKIDEQQPAPPTDSEDSASDSIAPLELTTPPAVEEKLEEVSEPVEVTEEPLQQGTPVDKDEHVFEFEPGLQPTTETPTEDDKIVPKPKDKPVQEEKDENSIEFVLNPVEEPPPPKEAIQPVKSKAALETLLALAKTYIGMDDLEAANQALQEVLDFGNKEQKLEAKRLLDELGKK